MKKYETPELELLSFSTEDLMATSDEFETTQDPYVNDFAIQSI